MAKTYEFRNKRLINQILNSENKRSINQLVKKNALKVKDCYSLQNLSIFTLGEVIEISSNQYGLSLFSGMISLLALGVYTCLLYTSPSPRDKRQSRMPSSA